MRYWKSHSRKPSRRSCLRPRSCVVFARGQVRSANPTQTTNRRMMRGAMEMATTQRKTQKGPRVRVSGAARHKEAAGAESPDARYGLLTAALVGVAIGAGSSLLFRRQ